MKDQWQIVCKKPNQYLAGITAQTTSTPDRAQAYWDQLMQRPRPKLAVRMEGLHFLAGCGM
jgi:hypothetical protein